MALTREETKKYHDYWNNKIGRYPEGFRHYENFANYSQVKKDATIQEYMEVMNKPCELQDYAKIRSHRLIEETNTVEFRQQWRKQVIDDFKRRNDVKDDDEYMFDVSYEDLAQFTTDGLSMKEKIDQYLQSEDFMETVRKDYASHVQTALLEKKNFTFVEAIEEFMDFWQVGRNLFHLPTHNVYIPVRNTIMKKPNMRDEDILDDELGYMYNNYDAKDKTRMRFGPMD